MTPIKNRSCIVWKTFALGKKNIQFHVMSLRFSLNLVYILERIVIFAIETRGFDKRVQISSSMQAAYRFLSIKRIRIAEYNYSFKKKLFGNRNKIRSCVKENPM